MIIEFSETPTQIKSIIIKCGNSGIGARVLAFLEGYFYLRQGVEIRQELEQRLITVFFLNQNEQISPIKQELKTKISYFMRKNRLCRNIETL